MHDPTRIINKAKLHILTHLPDDIRRLGPSIRFSTEIFECYNAVFRTCSVLSNHQAPSRDIALKMAELDRIKQLLSGGFWMNGNSPTQASKNVRSLLRETSVIQNQLGWTPEQAAPPPGSILMPAMAKRVMREWHETESRKAIAKDGLHRPICNWILASEVTAQSSDGCKVGSWVCYQWDQVSHVVPDNDCSSTKLFSSFPRT